MEAELVGINQAAELAGKSKNALNAAVARGELRRILQGGRMLFDPEDVARWKFAKELGWDDIQRASEEAREQARVRDEEMRERCASQAAVEGRAVREREAARRLASDPAAMIEALTKLQLELTQLRHAPIVEQTEFNCVSDSPQS